VPKQIYKIDQFHGGLNTNADPRDIGDNELSAATDIMVDELGKIRSIGSSSAHASESGVHTNEITPGYGLFAWNSDRTAAQVKIADYSGSHTGSDNQDGSASNPMVDGAPATFPVDALIGATITNTTSDKGGTATITDNTATNIIHSTALTGSDDWDNGDTYKISNIPTTGENYLAFSDADETGTVKIYGMGTDTWDTPIIGQTDQTGGTRKDVFYVVDGNLRICDSEFKNTNTTKWHGYADRIFMASASGNETTVDYWTTQSQYITRPSSNSGWDDAISTSATTSTGHTHSTTSTGIGTALTDIGTLKYFQLENVLNDGAGDAVSNIYTMDITVRVQYDGVDDSTWSYTLTAGDATDTDTFAGTLGTHHKSTSYVSEGSVEDINVIEDRVHTFTFAIGDTAQGTGSTAGVRAILDVDFFGGDVDSIDIHQVVITEGQTTGGAHNGVGGSAITTNEIFVEAKFEATTDAIGWGKKWEHGFSFIYDEKQESLVRRIEKVDPSSGSSEPPTYVQDNTANDAHAPSIRISIPYDSQWSPRITGGVWYIRSVSGDVPSKWWAQAECNFVSGTIKVLQNGVEYDATFNPTTSEFNFDIDHENLLQPNQTDTYFSRNGFAEDNDSLSARFKSVVQVGRRMYIGNVQIIKNDGSKEVKGDGMIKSPVNRFDTFPSKSLIEAAVNDGESITALEEFADRILQFKEQTLYIINVSQDIEFLEDVYKHKGVLLPAAVCKTDYGCAWVNRLGCYLYDGKQVINLLEKGGRQIIKESDWLSFTTNNSIIGYLPKKRQLIVLKDCTGTSVGDIFLYDMVTQSWVQGDSAFTDSQEQTNFVNDSNGDLVWSHTSDTGTMRVWSDASATTTNISFKTKDFDFGQPAQRKKIYKAYVSYKGDGGAITVNYGTDGNSTMAGQFYITGSTGASTKANAADLCIYDASVGTNDWVLAELIPSSSINNIDSFRLKFDGGTTDANFEINDISVIYRMKNIK
jgi:hypothetical protein